MNKTKIEWCDATWNPVTGCLHGCDYCYARRIAERFMGCDMNVAAMDDSIWPLAVFDKAPVVTRKNGKTVAAPFPIGFDPTFHRYRLDEPQHMKKPQTIFVCSMADLFGNWVPNQWLQEVFDACRKAPQHRYLFLTKNPERYERLASRGQLPWEENFWYGSTATEPDMPFWWSNHHNTFVSIEPLIKPFGRAGGDAVKKVGWIILGAMTGPGAKDHQPKPEWIEDIVADADCAGVPVFMKDSLVPVIGEANMRREFPWEGET